jgi:hypothetical protein
MPGSPPEAADELKQTQERRWRRAINSDLAADRRFTG